MGYFSSGSELLAYKEKYCSNCVNWTKREGEDEEGCPIMDYHYLDNYEMCNVKDNYLDKFIPRSENGLWNMQCVMYLPKKEVLND